MNRRVIATVLTLGGVMLLGSGETRNHAAASGALQCVGWGAGTEPQAVASSIYRDEQGIVHESVSCHQVIYMAVAHD